MKNKMTNKRKKNKYFLNPADRRLFAPTSGNHCTVVGI